jgi:DNA phosphorothioation-associated DGQHR protein 1
MMNTNVLLRPAIRIEQPLGVFYAFSLDAQTLNKLTYSQPAEARKKMEEETAESGGYSIFGTQRKESPNRLNEISKFIRSSEATFPNTIILAANYDNEGRLIEDKSIRWDIHREKGQDFIRIPVTNYPTASIIDGQHRLHAFELLEVQAPHRNMELLCVVFLELPTPYHAYVFATINFNQKKVDRSLAYELFGFDVEEREPKYWAPETLAVYIARLLNTAEDSPLKGCIVPAAEALGIESAEVNNALHVSMATIVDGILKLISKKPKEDRYEIRRPENIAVGREVLPKNTTLPLRSFYLANNDKAIYNILFNYFYAVGQTVWKTSLPGSYLKKTVGVQALFDLLQYLLNKLEITETNFSIVSLSERLKVCENLDPEGTKYQASGIGRMDIKKDLLAEINRTLDQSSTTS